MAVAVHTDPRRPPLVPTGHEVLGFSSPDSVATVDRPYVGDKAPPHEVQMAVEVALRSGRGVDDAAVAGLAVASSPILVIKALRNAVPGLSLADAKPIVDRNLPPDVAAATEALRDALEEEVRDALEEGVGVASGAAVLTWCVVANVEAVRSSATKHFLPGARVWVLPPQWGDGGDDLLVVGHHRGAGGGIARLVISRRHLTNFRAKPVYSPTVMSRLEQAPRDGVDAARLWQSREEAVEVAAIWAAPPRG